MRLTETDVTMIKLESLAEDIKQANVALPDFQRSFKWSERDIRAFLATVLKGWPSGNLLVMRGRSDWFTVRGFDGGPEPKPTARLVILDGQQRLTSIYRALWDVGPYVYALDLKSFDNSDIDNLEDSIVGVKRATWDERYRELAAQREHQLVPLYTLRSPSDFFAWRDDVVKTAKAADRDNVATQLSDVYRSTLTRVNAYEFPAVVLEHGADPTAVARIFERVNKSGMRLGTFDLMVARAYGLNWNLREKWTSARERYPHIDRFLGGRDEQGGDGMPLLQTISMVESSNVRQSAVLELKPEIVKNRWDSVTGAMNQALVFLVANCGVADASWLPFRGMVLPLAGLALEGVSLDQHRDLLTRWFWDRSFNNSFEIASNTRLVSDYRELMQAVGTGSIATSSPVRSTILEATKRSAGSIWRAVVCAIAAQHPSDFAGNVLELERAIKRPIDAEEVLEIVSVFDASDDLDEDAPSLSRRALGMIFVSTDLALEVKEKTMTTVVAATIRDLGKKQVNEALETQFVAGADAVLEAADDPVAFLEGRCDLLSAFLKQQTGNAFV